MRKLSAFLTGLSMLLAVGVFAPTAISATETGQSAGQIGAAVLSNETSRAVIIRFTEKGEVKDISHDLPPGFKVEVMKDAAVLPKCDSGMHMRTFMLHSGNRHWRDAGHSPHYLASGQRQAHWVSWTPDQSVGCFVGVYYVEGNYAIGLTNPSPNNVLVTVGTSGNYRPQVSYYGSRPFPGVHFSCHYWPYW